MAWGFETLTSAGMIDVSASSERSALLVGGGVITTPNNGSVSIPQFNSNKGFLIVGLDQYFPLGGGGGFTYEWNNSTKMFSWQKTDSDPIVVYAFHNADAAAPASEWGIEVRNDDGDVFFDSSRTPLVVRQSGTSTGVKHGDVYIHNLPRGVGVLSAVQLSGTTWGTWGINPSFLGPITGPIDPPEPRYFSSAQTLSVRVLGFSADADSPEWGIEITDSAGLVWHSADPVALIPAGGIEKLQGADMPTLSLSRGHWWVQTVPSMQFTITVDFPTNSITGFTQDIYGVVAATSGGDTRMLSLRIASGLSGTTASLINAPANQQGIAPWARLKVS